MKKGFTLIELLVCIAIIAILIGLSAKSLKSAREQAIIRKCGINLKQIYNGTYLYVTSNKELYPYADSIASLNTGYLEPYQALKGYISENVPFIANGEAVMMSPYHCPKDDTKSGFSYIYAPYELMRNWPSVDPQYAVSKVLMNTPLEPLFLDAFPWHKNRKGESLLIRCDGSIVIRENKQNTAF